MKINYCRSTNSFTLKGLTAQQLTVLYAVIKTADDRCFSEQDETGTWHSNDDFVLSLDDNERTALTEIVSYIKEYLS